MAFEQFGYEIPAVWRRLKRYTMGRRMELKSEDIGEHWEWLAHDFEKRRA